MPNLSYRDFTRKGIFEQGSLSESAKIHGSACAEIVHDIAPDAEIQLYKVDNLVSLENAKDAAIQDGMDIVTVSLGWDVPTGFGDGTGLACDIVDDAFQNNVLWVNASLMREMKPRARSQHCYTIRMTMDFIISKVKMKSSPEECQPRRAK